MIKHAGVITVASALTPFARVGGQNGQKRRRESELSTTRSSKSCRWSRARP